MKLFTEDSIRELLDDSSSLEEFTSKLDDLSQVYEIKPLDIKQGQAGILMFPVEYGDMITELAPLFQKIYPDNPIVAIVNDIDLLIENSDGALNLIDNIRAKISILKDTNDAGKLII